MVWAMTFPSVFGEFFPKGKMVGYQDVLNAHFDEFAIPEEKSRGLAGYRFRVTEKFHSEIGSSRIYNPPLSPIKPHEWPTEFKIEKPREALGAFLKLPNRTYAVTSSLKSIIEDLEPGVHQFNPILIKNSKGENWPDSYHVIVVGRHLDSFRPEQSDPRCLRSPGKSLFPYDDESKESYIGIAMDEGAIESAHLWSEHELRGPEFFLSDRLQSEIKKSGLRAPKHFKMKSVSSV